MKIFYRAIDGGFYPEDWFGPREVLVPDPDWRCSDDNPNLVAPLLAVPNPDCRLPPAAELVEITAEQHQGLLAAEQSGLIIRPDEQGFPVASPVPQPSVVQLAERERLWRDGALAQTDTLVQRHRDEIEVGGTTTVSLEQYQELQAYRLALRAWPESEAFPAELERPAAPGWLAGQL